MGKIYSHLSLEERALIQTQLRMGIKPGTIARGMRRIESKTIEPYGTART